MLLVDTLVWSQVYTLNQMYDYWLKSDTQKIQDVLVELRLITVFYWYDKKHDQSFNEPKCVVNIVEIRILSKFLTHDYNRNHHSYSHGCQNRLFVEYINHLKT